MPVTERMLGCDAVMPKQSGGLGLPYYQRSKDQQRWVASKRRTSNLIRSLWTAAGTERRREPAFLCLLVQCGWTNAGRNKGQESTRLWRNQNIADYLKVVYCSDEQLAKDLASRLKSLTVSKALSLLEQQTGITRYYTAFRPATLRFVKQHSVSVALAFNRVSAMSTSVTDKIQKVATIIENLGDIPAAGRHISPFNGLTPALSCLDTQRRFPIMNDRTRDLLSFIEMNPDKEGIVALSKLIGPEYGIKDAFELDAYAFGEKFPMLKARPHKLRSASSFIDVGLKSEINSIANIAAKKATIKKLHNKLTNRLRDYILWRQKTVKQSKFDALVLGWKKGRDLLIEAKTASEGPSGRSQVRQAIGQLYDYRFTYMPKNNVDLAVLLKKEPSAHVQRLLASLDIELLWFKGKELTGTTQL
jgi:hypothetical protein